jgi:hypothetical protein
MMYLTNRDLLILLAVPCSIPIGVVKRELDIVELLSIYISLVILELSKESTNRGIKCLL